MPSILRPRSADERRRRPSLFDVVVDDAQRGAVLPAERALLVLGEAGHGKTTVALHRLAEIWRSTHVVRAAMIVPTEGLPRSNQLQLRRLSAHVEVLTYDQWASAQARRAFRRLRKESDSSPPSVMRVKLSPALRSASWTWRRASRGSSTTIANVVRTARAHTPGAAISNICSATERCSSASFANEDRGACDRGRARAHARSVQPHGGRTSTRTSIGRASSRSIDARSTKEPLPPMRAPSTRRTTPFSSSSIGCAERRGAPATKPRPFDLVAIDEAQDFAPLELALIGRSLSPRATLVVAGDADQQTDATTSFVSWEDVMDVLGRPDHERVMLDIGYRCPPDVVAMARGMVSIAGTENGNASMIPAQGDQVLGIVIAPACKVLDVVRLEGEGRSTPRHTASMVIALEDEAPRRRGNIARDLSVLVHRVGVARCARRPFPEGRRSCLRRLARARATRRRS